MSDSRIPLGQLSPSPERPTGAPPLTTADRLLTARQRLHEAITARLRAEAEVRFRQEAVREAVFAEQILRDEVMRLSRLLESERVEGETP